jgi:hypothetical protein
MFKSLILVEAGGRAGGAGDVGTRTTLSPKEMANVPEWDSSRDRCAKWRPDGERNTLQTAFLPYPKRLMGGISASKGSKWLRRWARNAGRWRSSRRAACPTCREKAEEEGGRRHTLDRPRGGEAAREAGRLVMSDVHWRRR